MRVLWSMRQGWCQGRLNLRICPFLKSFREVFEWQIPIVLTAKHQKKTWGCSDGTVTSVFELFGIWGYPSNVVKAVYNLGYTEKPSQYLLIRTQITNSLWFHIQLKKLNNWNLLCISKHITSMSCIWNMSKKYVCIFPRDTDNDVE